MCACLVDLRHIGRSKLYLGAGSLGASPGPILAEELALLEPKLYNSIVIGGREWCIIVAGLKSHGG